jgi:hypothetical protein
MRRLADWFWLRTYTGFRVCALLGHATCVLLWQRGNEDCDCGADHTYWGCARCRMACDIEGEP